MRNIYSQRGGMLPLRSRLLRFMLSTPALAISIVVLVGEFGLVIDALAGTYRWSLAFLIVPPVFALIGFISAGHLAAASVGRVPAWSAGPIASRLTHSLLVHLGGGPAR